MCPFCEAKIIDSSFLSNEVALAIYNIAPILPGHSLIIPKNHIESIFSLNKYEFDAFMQLAREATQLLCKAFNTQAFNWTIQEQAAAGQTIPHLHLHLIPRVENDLAEPGDWYPTLQKKFYQEDHIDNLMRPQLNEREMSQIVSHLRTFSSINMDTY